MKLLQRSATDLSPRPAVLPAAAPNSRPSTATIAIVGLGYVGLPLSLQFARSGVAVIGLDIDSGKVDSLVRGHSYIQHVPSEAIARMKKAGKLSASTDFSHIREVEAVIICVPTPLNKNREPDISFVLNTGKAIAPFLGAQRRASLADNRNHRAMVGNSHNPQLSTRQSETAKKLIVLESTTYPGTTDEDLRAILEETSGLKAGVDFHLAFSPEREDPGNPDSKVATIPKVIGGHTPA